MDAHDNLFASADSNSSCILAVIMHSSLYGLSRASRPIFQIIHVILDDLQLGRIVPCVAIRLK